MDARPCTSRLPTATPYSLLSRKGAFQKSRYSNAELTTTPAKLVPAIHSMAKGPGRGRSTTGFQSRLEDGSRAQISTSSAARHVLLFVWPGEDLLDGSVTRTLRA